jgi:hypothetical protein
VGPAEDVVALELRLLEPAVRADPDAVGRLLHPDFREFSVSGGVWDRTAVLAALAADPGHGLRVSDMRADTVSDGVVLVTYVTERTRRSSLWVLGDDGWRVLFHQGTPA